MAQSRRNTGLMALATGLLIGSAGVAALVVLLVPFPTPSPEPEPPRALATRPSATRPADPTPGPKPQDNPFDPAAAIPAIENQLPTPGQPRRSPVRAAEDFPDLKKGQQLALTWRALLDGGVGAVHGLAVSPDGKWLAARRGRRVDLWELSRGQLQASWFTPLPGPCVFAPDGRLVVAVGREVWLMEVPSGQRLSRTFLPRALERLAVSPDGAVAAGIGVEGLFFIALTSGKWLAYRENPGRALALAFTPDGQSLAVASADAVELLELPSLQRRRPFATPGARSLAFSPDGRWLAVGLAGGMVELWDVPAGTSRLLQGDDQARIEDLAFSPGGKYLAGAGRAVHLWEPGTGTLLASHGGFLGAGRFCFGPDGLTLALAGSAEGYLSLVNLEPTRQHSRMSMPETPWYLAVDSTGKTAVAATLSSLRRHDLTTGTGSALPGVKEILGLALSPDGKTLAVAEASAVGLYNMTDQKITASLPTLFPGEQILAWSRDGKELAVASGNEIQLWEVAGRKLLRTLQGHGDRVNCLAFSPDGQLLASGAEDATARIWDLDKGMLRRTLQAHERSVTCLAWSSDGNRLATGGPSLDPIARLWEAATGKELATFEGASQALLAIGFADSERVLVALGVDRLFRAWDVKNARLLAEHPCQPGEGLALAVLSGDGRRVVTAGHDRSLRTWVLDELIRPGPVQRTAVVRQDSRPLVRPSVPPRLVLRVAGTIERVALSPDGKFLASIGRQVRLWDLARGELWRTLDGLNVPGRTLAFSADGAILFAGGGDERAGVAAWWDVKTGRQLGQVPDAEGPVTSLALSPEDAFLLYCGPDKGFHLRALTLKSRPPRSGLSLPGDRLLALARAGQRLALGGLGQQVHLYHPATLEPLRVLPAAGVVLALSLSADGQTLAVAASLPTGRTQVQLWQVDAGKSLDLPQTGRRVETVALSPDGRWLALGELDTDGRGRLTLQDAKTGESRLSLPAVHAAAIRHVVFSTDGKLLVSAGADGLVKVWDLADLTDQNLPRAAGQVLALGGQVERVGEQVHFRLRVRGRKSRKALQELARLQRPWTLDLSASVLLEDADLVSLAQARELRGLSLANNPALTDRALAHLKPLRQLQELNLQFLSKITAQGLQELRGLPLESLNLSFTGLDGENLAFLGQFRRLRRLRLEKIRLGAATVKPLAEMVELEELELRSSGLGDAGLAPLKGLKKLRRLGLAQCDLSDAGLAVLKSFPDLELLDLGDQPITDAGLIHLKELKKLRWLGLQRTRVQGAGLAHLSGLKTLEGLRLDGIEGFDGRAFAHLKGLDRLIELDLSRLALTDEGLAGLRELTQLEALALPATTTDAGLAHLANLKRLRSLNVADFASNIKGPGLAALTGLLELDLKESPVTDAGLAALKGLTNLYALRLPRQTGDAGLEHVRGLVHLRILRLDETAITDAGLTNLKGLTNLEELDLFGTKVRDSGLVHLHALKSLRRLDLSRTQVTEEGKKQLRKALPELTLEE